MTQKNILLTIFLPSALILVLYARFVTPFSTPNGPSHLAIKTLFLQKIQKNRHRSICLHERNEESRVIIGGELDELPPVLKAVQTDDSKHFVDKCWDERMSVPEAVEHLNRLTEPMDETVVEKVLYEGANTSDGKDEAPINQPGVCKLQSEARHEPVGMVELNPVSGDELSEESSDEEFLEVDYGLLTFQEIAEIRNLMREQVKNSRNMGGTLPTEDHILENDPNPEECGPGTDEKLAKIADLFIKLNRNTGMSALDLDWIPTLESKLYKFLKSMKYTLSTATWTEDSLIIVLADKNLPEDEVSKIYDEVHKYINELARTEYFRGLTNIGFMISGSDP